MNFNTPFPLEVEYLQSGELHTGTEWKKDVRKPHLISEQFIKVYWIHEGEGTLNIGSRTLNLSPGYLYLIPEHIPFGYECPSRIHLFWLHFNVYFGLSFEFLKQCKYLLCIRAEEPSLFSQCFENFNDRRDMWDRSLCQASLILLLQRFIVSVNRQDTSRPQEKSLHEYIHTMSFEKMRTLTVQQMADDMHVRPEHFARLFKQCYQISPKHYLLKARLHMARRMLTQTQHTLETIAEDTGFYDAFHFSKTFKKHWGIAPAHYRSSTTGLR